MGERITIKIDGNEHECTRPLRPGTEEPSQHTEFVLCQTACPGCTTQPMRVAGADNRFSQDGRAYEADGRCLDCGHKLGLLKLEPNTIFGAREDAAVLCGRWRVY